MAEEHEGLRMQDHRLNLDDARRFIVEDELLATRLNAYLGRDDIVAGAELGFDEVVQQALMVNRKEGFGETQRDLSLECELALNGHLDSLMGLLGWIGRLGPTLEEAVKRHNAISPLKETAIEGEWSNDRVRMGSAMKEVVLDQVKSFFKADFSTLLCSEKHQQIASSGFGTFWANVLRDIELNATDENFLDVVAATISKSYLDIWASLEINSTAEAIVSMTGGDGGVENTGFENTVIDSGVTTLSLDLPDDGEPLAGYVGQGADGYPDMDIPLDFPAGIVIGAEPTDLNGIPLEEVSSRMDDSKPQLPEDCSRSIAAWVKAILVDDAKPAAGMVASLTALTTSKDLRELGVIGLSASVTLLIAQVLKLRNK